MTTESGAYTAWIGRTESLDDDLSPGQARSAAATFDDATTDTSVGAALPPLWHWFYFLPRAPQAALDDDGHPRRGGFMPPLPHPRRMFAGGRLRVHRPLRLGRSARREGVIRNVAEKVGRSGPLAFVTVGYRYIQDGDLCLEEEQEIVYREPGPPVAAPVVAEPPPPPTGAWARTITPDPRLLFRFSALTFNAHRIHYDRPYAIQAEGYPGLVVHGPLTAVLLLDMVRHHAGRSVVGFSFRALAPLFDLAPFQLVARPDGDEVALEAYGPDGATALSATAELG